MIDGLMRKNAIIDKNKYKSFKQQFFLSKSPPFVLNSFFSSFCLEHLANTAKTQLRPLGYNTFIPQTLK
jgi:hypothetical protein